jgi:HAD superfamily hydrolase (TIGR01509 family)
MIPDRFHIPELPTGDFDAFIFDCDGTLADSMPLHYSTWCAAIGERHGHFPKALFYSWGGKKGHEIVRHLNELHGTAMDIDATVADKQARYLDAVHAVTPVGIVYDIANQSRGKIRMAVASGGHRRLVERTLTAIGALDWFDAVVCAEDYARGKPAPDPFLEAARRLAVEPARCLVFEDTVPGIQAATAAGMQSVLVTDRDLAES